MKEFEESRPVFRFDDNWIVEQWDAHPAYRGADGFDKAPGTKACDFVGRHESGAVYLIEVKNFIGYHHDNRHRLEREGLPTEAAAKVRDTLAGLFWTRGRSADVSPLAEVISHVLDATIASGSRGIRVVLWVEDRPPLDPAVASAMMSDLRRQLLRWFKISKVLVASLDSAEPTMIPGLTVRLAS